MSDTRRRLFASAIVGQFLFGISLALFGALFGIPAFTGALGLQLGTQAYLLVALYSGHLLFTAVLGRLVDRFGALRILATGAALLSGAMVLAGLADGSGQAIAAAAVMSVGGAAMNAGSNVLVSNAYGDDRGPMLNVVALFGALGAISVPFVFAGADSIAGVRARLFALAAFGVLTGIAHLAQRQPAPAPHEREARVSTRAILSDGWMVALIVLLAIDFGLESIAAGWFSTYTLETFPGGPATTMVGIYWTGLMLGRLLGPVLHARVPKLPILAGTGLVVSLAFAGVSAAPSVLVLGAVIALAGLALGPIGPTVLSVAGARYSRGTGAAFGVLLSLGQVGSITLPWTVAQVAERAGFRVAMLVASASALAFCALAAALWARRGVTGYLRQDRAGAA